MNTKSSFQNIVKEVIHRDEEERQTLEPKA
jgi:hypothetical protein